MQGQIKQKGNDMSVKFQTLSLDNKLPLGPGSGFWGELDQEGTEWKDLFGHGFTVVKLPSDTGFRILG